MSDQDKTATVEELRTSLDTSDFLRAGSWWSDELSGLWSDGSYAVTPDTRRAAKTALRVLLEMDAALRVIASGDGDPAAIAQQTLEAINNG